MTYFYYNIHYYKSILTLAALRDWAAYTLITGTQEEINWGGGQKFSRCCHVDKIVSPIIIFFIFNFLMSKGRGGGNSYNI